MWKFERLLAAALAALALLGLTAPTSGADESRKDALTKVVSIVLPPEAFAGLMSGTVIDWSEGVTQVRFNLEPDDKEGTDLDVATGEWELLFYAERCDERRGYPLLHEFFVNTSTYGPRVQVFPTPQGRGLVRQIGSIELIHDGPSPHHHVDQLGPGRHLMGCADVKQYRVL